MRTLTSDLTGSFNVVLEQSSALSVKPETTKLLESVSWTKILRYQMKITVNRMKILTSRAAVLCVYTPNLHIQPHE